MLDLINHIMLMLAMSILTPPESTIYQTSAIAYAPLSAFRVDPSDYQWSAAWPAAGTMVHAR